MLIKFSLPMQLLTVLIAVVALGHLLPIEMVSFFYTISLMLKEFLGFMLPFMVFSFIAAGVLSFKKNTPIVIAILLACVFTSNLLVPLISYFCCSTILHDLTSNIALSQVSLDNSIHPLYTISLPRVIAPEHAIFLAIAIGSITSFYKATVIEDIIATCKQSIEWIINTVFIPVLPLYVFGFLLEVHARGIFFQLFQSYGKTYALIIMLQTVLTYFIYLLASNFNLAKTFQYIKNAVPSYLTAFSTMSSAAAIPVTIKCAEKNTKNPALSSIATPILANIHLFGDAITVPVLALVTLFLFKGIIPAFTTIVTFFVYFSLTMLAASGIPGGGVIVVIPILKSILGFNDTMVSLMVTLHLLQDGLGTGTNVMGDGALMIIINNILKKAHIK